jgi:hypothetical protein
MRRRGLRLDHPLFNQFVEQPPVALRMAFDQLLESVKFAHLALQNNVAFDARHNAVHHARRLRRRGPAERVRRACRSQKQDEDENRLAHQNVVPRLIKNWNPGSLVSVVRQAAVVVGGHVPL